MTMIDMIPASNAEIFHRKVHNNRGESTKSLLRTFLTLSEASTRKRDAEVSAVLPPVLSIIRTPTLERRMSLGYAIKRSASQNCFIPSFAHCDNLLK